MGRLVFDTLGLSMRLQRERGLSVEAADAMAHDVMFGFLATQPDATPDSVAESVGPLRSERLDSLTTARRETGAPCLEAGRSG